MQLRGEAVERLRPIELERAHCARLRATYQRFVHRGAAGGIDDRPKDASRIIDRPFG
ncbi:hypothetical protein APY03_2290 [Variovorax sp. WDL1]|nr:hypothetical protein APY03_2290 [Variovorax sp. WDL1]